MKFENIKTKEMKKLLFLPLVIALGIMSCDADESPAESDRLPVGSKIPKAEVKMKNINDKEMALKDGFKKNGLLVMFSCNTCPYVVKNQDRTREISKYALDNNIGVILINSNEGTRDGDDSFEAMKEYAKAQGYNWHYVVDQNSVVADAFGAKRTPECFLFNQEESLVYHGAIDDNPSDAGNIKRAHLKEAMNEIVSGKEVSVRTSLSVGCSIKR
jgi:thioredoxin-related protein